MGTQFFHFDINAKLPIIRDENPFINGIINANNQLELPKPSFRPAQNYEYCKRNFTSKGKMNHNYYHYEEPTPDELMTRVEYDMDIQDIEWLRQFNTAQGLLNQPPVTENDFEKVMDRLEKESYFESKKSGGEMVQTVDEDAVCAICNDGDCHNANVILFCDMCDLAVHQECYGVPYIPEGQWLCRRCLQSPSRNVKCVLCPNMGGAFKQTDDNRWAHVICALWIPEVCFANTVFLEPIDSINQIPAARWKLNCYICRQKKVGACIQCHKPNCYLPFHVTCAQQAGLYMKIRTHKYDTPEGSFTDVKKEAFCDLHRPSEDKTKSGGMYSGDEEDAEETDNDEDSVTWRRMTPARSKSIQKTRKILAEKRKDVTKVTALVKVNGEKLVEMARLLNTRGRRIYCMQSDESRLDIVKHIHKYWELKRASRNGVPLLRRLQVSYNSNTSRQNDGNFNKDEYTRLRYDLEKARLLVGEVKKRELIKKKLFRMSKGIIELKFQSIDKIDPPNEDE